MELVYNDDEVKAYTMNRDSLRQVLTSTVSRVELNPYTREFTIHYRLPLTAYRLPE